MDPCGTPQWIGAGGEVNDPIFTEKVLPFKYEANHSKASTTLIVVVVARAGLFTVRQIPEWAHIFFFFIFFALRHRPLSLPQPPPSSVLRWRRLCPCNVVIFDREQYKCDYFFQDHLTF